jgi:hypothetical protein
MHSDFTDNREKVLYAAELSLYVTAYIFNDSAIVPDSHFERVTHAEGAFGATYPGAYRAAYASALQIWGSQFIGNRERIRLARESVGGDYRRYWLRLGEALGDAMDLSPSGIATSIVEDFIQAAQESRRERDLRRRREERLWRRGGALQTSDGFEFTIPPETLPPTGD